jgi:hypothetical protein
MLTEVKADIMRTDIEGTDLLSEENLSDINDIAAVMKLWFRELPEPLLTWELYHGFIEAASKAGPSSGSLRSTNLSHPRRNRERQIKAHPFA